MSTQPRFALFVGDFYYPIGGWEDLGGFGEVEDMKLRALDRVSGYTSPWAHIVDMEKRVVVARMNSELVWVDVEENNQ